MEKKNSDLKIRYFALCFLIILPFVFSQELVWDILLLFPKMKKYNIWVLPAQFSAASIFTYCSITFTSDSEIFIDFFEKHKRLDQLYLWVGEKAHNILIASISITLKLCFGLSDNKYAREGRDAVNNSKKELLEQYKTSPIKGKKFLGFLAISVILLFVFLAISALYPNVASWLSRILAFMISLIGMLLILHAAKEHFPKTLSELNDESDTFNS